MRPLNEEWKNWLVETIQDGGLDNFLQEVGHEIAIRQSRTNRGPFADSGLYRKNAPETSKQAALKFSVGSSRTRVLLYIARGGEVTREGISDLLGISPNTVRPRVKELIDHGFVKVARDSKGEIVTHVVASGANAEALSITVTGRERAQQLRNLGMGWVGQR